MIFIVSESDILFQEVPQLQLSVTAPALPAVRALIEAPSARTRMYSCPIAGEFSQENSLSKPQVCGSLRPK
ncbi:MAG: hypothetical protein NC041_02330 [Bacteroides sp.]|nr:hypothetical protein [Prevotella sp.]MCM1407560.1 hypothetical protein [Treponema brennaborense]MCM1469290.1 hypothetical protein [Bacteroides sp.]